MTTPTTESEQTQLKLNISDVYAVAQALDVSIKRKTFTEEEIKTLYGPWSNVMRFCEDIKRKNEVEKLYNDETPKVEEETPKVEEETPKVEELSIN